MEKNKSILGKIEELLQAALSLRKDYLRQTAPNEELICGEWVRDGSHTSFRIYEDQGKMMIDNRTANSVNDRLRTTTSALAKDAQGNMYFSFMEYAVAYDREKDILTVETYGEFQRKKNE